MRQSAFESWSKTQKNGWNGAKSTLKASLYGLPASVFPLLFTAGELDDSFSLASSTEYAQSDNITAKGLTCITCGLKFLSHPEQQAHFKSDLHLVNLKRKLAGRAIKVKMQELDTDVATEGVDAVALQQQESESSEESEGSDQEKEAKDEEVEEDLLRPAQVRTSDGVIKRECSAHRGPAFHVQDFSIPGWEVVLSGALFPAGSVFSGRDWVSLGDDSKTTGTTEAKKSGTSLLWITLGAHLRAVQANPITAVFLLRSGRFAGAVFSGSTLLIHKVMRRYTVRAKAGGGQSSHDNKSGKAKSAGAMLRRYGETALREDVAECLRLWSGHIQSCSLVLISAPKTMRSDLFVEELASSGGRAGAMVLAKDDPRIVYVPFMVGRPTLDEAKAVHDRCTSVYFNRLDAAAAPSAEGGAGVDGSLTASVDGEDSAVTKSVKKVPPHVSAAAHPVCPASQRLFLACQEGEESLLGVLEELRAETAEGHLFDVTHEASSDAADAGVAETYSVELSAVLAMVDSLESLSTVLHLAASAGMARAVGVLLSLGASPMSGDVRGRTPYFLAKDKEARDAFRRYRGTEEGENRWDWSAAGVGAALSEEAERQQREREKEKEREKKKRAAQRKKDQKQQEADQQAQAESDRLRQVEEQKARAQEALNSAGVCATCGVSLFGKHALDIYDRRCCGADCVLKLRRKLAADAATKRFQGSS